MSRPGRRVTGLEVLSELLGGPLSAHALARRLWPESEALDASPARALLALLRRRGLVEIDAAPRAPGFRRGETRLHSITDTGRRALGLEAVKP